MKATSATSPPARLRITDRHGIHYDVADLKALDRACRRILDRFP